MVRGKGGGSGVLESMLEQESGACPGFFKGGVGGTRPRQNLHSSFSFWRPYFLPAPRNRRPLLTFRRPPPFVAISPPIFRLFSSSPPFIQFAVPIKPFFLSSQFLSDTSHLLVPSLFLLAPPCKIKGHIPGRHASDRNIMQLNAIVYPTVDL